MSGQGSFVFFCAFLGFLNALLQRGGSGPMVGGGGVGPKSARVAGVGGHLSWGHWHRDTLPVLTWAIWVEALVCPQGPGGGLGPGGVTSCPAGRAGRPGVSPSQEASGQGSGLSCRGLHPENQEVRGLWGAR